MKHFYVGKRMVGTYDNGVFFKEINLSKHLFKVLDALGIDSKAINSLPETTLVKIHDIEHDDVYTAIVGDFKKNGVYYHFKEEKKDHHTQLFLSRKYFKIEKPKELTEDEKAHQDYKKMFL